MFHRTFIIFGSDFATKFQFPLEMLYIIFFYAEHFIYNRLHC